jgi:hypothetical protein
VEAWLEPFDGAGKFNDGRGKGSNVHRHYYPRHASTVILDPGGHGYRGCNHHGYRGDCGRWRHGYGYRVFRTIEAALRHVVWGGTILVAPGPVPVGVHGPVVIDKAVHIRGLYGNDAYVFEAVGPECIAIIAPSVIIQGATWVGRRGGGGHERACVRADRGSVILRNNIFDWQGRGPAIWARGGRLRIEHSRVAAFGPALHVIGGSVVVDKSELRSATVAALTERVGRAEFVNVRFFGGERAAIHSMGSQTTVARSEVIGGHYGIVVTNGAPGVTLVEGSFIHDQREAGFFFGDDAKAVIHHNRVAAPDCKDGSTRYVEWDDNDCSRASRRHRRDRRDRHDDDHHDHDHHDHDHHHDHRGGPYLSSVEPPRKFE